MAKRKLFQSNISIQIVTLLCLSIRVRQILWISQDLSKDKEINKLEIGVRRRLGTFGWGLKRIGKENYGSLWW